MKLSKKHFLKNCYFSFKKFIGRSPKEFKEVFGQKHPNKKSYQFLLGKTLQKETLKKQCGRTAWFPKKSSLERRCNKSVDFYALLGLSGGFAEWKKGMHFGAQVWISIPFLGLSGGFAARKKGMHFGARVWISMPFLGFLGEAAAWKKGKQFEVSGRGWKRKLFYLIPLTLLYLIPLILLYLIPLILLYLIPLILLYLIPLILLYLIPLVLLYLIPLILL